MTIELSEYVIDAIADAVVKKMQDPSYNSIKTELEPCEDVVSRQAAIDTIDKWVKNMHVLTALPANEVTPLFDSMHELPSVTPQPKMGKWIWSSGDERVMIGMCYHQWTCSSCKKKVELKTDYCPHCGSCNGGEEE